jgi:hypothetical protein
VANGLATTTKYLRGAAGIGLGTTNKYRAQYLCELKIIFLYVYIYINQTSIT